MKSNFIIAFLAICSVFTNASADIVLDKIILDFFPGEEQQENIFVNNTSSTENVYVKIEQVEVLNAGTKDEKREKVKKTDQHRLIVSPNKLSIRQNNRKVVQFIVNNNNSDKDKIYRVQFSPVISGFYNNTQNSSNVYAGIKLLIGYEVLVIVRPTNMRFKLDVNRKDNTIIAKNNGNTNVFINRIKQCNDKNVCESLIEEKRLYANSDISLKLVYPDRPVIMELNYGKDYKVIEYN